MFAKKKTDFDENREVPVRIVKNSFLAALLCVCITFGAVPLKVYAFKHAYKKTTDFEYANARHGMTVYTEPGGDIQDYIPEFEGAVAVGQDGSWLEVEYKKKKKIRYGWVTRDEFYGSSLIYDGRDKQIISDGTYRARLEKASLSSDRQILPNDSMADTACNLDLLLTFTYAGNNTFTIKNEQTGRWLLPDPWTARRPRIRCWGSEAEAGRFILIRKKNVFRIMDADSHKYLRINEVSCLPEFTKEVLDGNSTWRLNRTAKAIEKGNLRDIVQYDPEWAHYHYGKGRRRKTEEGNFCTSGCGIFASMNLIYSLTGNMADPLELGDYASETGYRIEGSGTDSGFFSAMAKKFGYRYGFRYVGSNYSFSSLKRRLGEGQAAIVYLPGHYSAIVDYNKKTKKFLLLDPHYLPKRATSPWGDWVSRQDLESGGLIAQAFFYFERLDH